MRHVGDRADEIEYFFGRGTVFCGLTRCVDLDENACHRPRLFTKAVQCVGQFWTVDRVNKRKGADRFACFVALQRTDEVPPARERHLWRLFEKLLNSILPDVTDAGFDELAYPLGSKGLCYTDDLVDGSFAAATGARRPTRTWR